MYTLKGEVKVIMDEVQVTDSFKKREIVIIDASGQYEQTILFQTVQDRCEVLDPITVGDHVEVTFFLRGREWENPKDGEIKFFNSLDLWKIELLTKGKESTNDTADNAETFVADGDDDLPF